MSVNTGYNQYLRKFRLLITSTAKIKLAKTISTAPAVPAVSDGVRYSAKVKSNSLTMRKGPGTKYKSMGTLKKGRAIDLLTRNGKWYKAINPKKSNSIVYVCAKYVKVIGEQKTSGTDAAMETVQTIEQRKTIEITNLRCTFKCEKAVKDTPNYSLITVYNMSQETIASIKAGDTVVLEAGYEEGNYGMIFTGQVIQPYVTRETATDTALKLVVQDGDHYLNSAFVMTTLRQGCSNADVVRATMTGYPGIPASPG